MECSLTATSFGDHHDADDEFNERNISGGGRGEGGRIRVRLPKNAAAPFL